MTSQWADVWPGGIQKVSGQDSGQCPGLGSPFKIERRSFKIEGASEQSGLPTALPTNFLNPSWTVQLEMAESGQIKTCTLSMSMNCTMATGELDWYFTTFRRVELHWDIISYHITAVISYHISGVEKSHCPFFRRLPTFWKNRGQIWEL
jgi:hypothetical protein